MELTEFDKRIIRDLLKRQAVIHARKAAERHWCGGRLVRDGQGTLKCNRCGEKQAEGGARKGAVMRTPGPKPRGIQGRENTMAHERPLAKCPRFLITERRDRAGEPVVDCSACLFSMRHGQTCRMKDKRTANLRAVRRPVNA